MAKKRMGAPIKFTRNKQVRAKVMFAKGLTSVEVAGRLDLSYATIQAWRKKGMRLRKD
ncbi:MAG TPA: hypothetical protein VLJ17_24735 [Xanthobacteraceae bacterium]|nr:hypothetical protein [Xanthobacteraceae bacterium]